MFQYNALRLCVAGCCVLPNGATTIYPSKIHSPWACITHTDNLWHACKSCGLVRLLSHGLCDWFGDEYNTNWRRHSKWMQIQNVNVANEQRNCRKLKTNKIHQSIDVVLNTNCGRCASQSFIKLIIDSDVLEWKGLYSIGPSAFFGVLFLQTVKIAHSNSLTAEKGTKT